MNYGDTILPLTADAVNPISWIVVLAASTISLVALAVMHGKKDQYVIEKRTDA